MALNLSKEFNQKMFNHTELKKKRRKPAMSGSEEQANVSSHNSYDRLAVTSNEMLCHDQFRFKKIDYIAITEIFGNGSLFFAG